LKPTQERNFFSAIFLLQRARALREAYNRGQGECHE